MEDEIIDKEIKDSNSTKGIIDYRMQILAILSYLSGFIWRELNWPFAAEMIAIGNSILIVFFIKKAIREKFRYYSFLLLLLSIISFISIYLWSRSDGFLIVGIWFFLISLVTEILNLFILKRGNILNGGH